MAFELKQTLKLSQQLVMTPQLQQAIKLLQLSRLELTDLIRQEIDENPVLDEKMESESGEQGAEKDELSAANETSKDLSEVKNDNEFDWKDFVDNSINPSKGSYSAGGEEREQYDSIATKPDTFVDHLFWQLRLHDLNDKEMEIGENIIGNLNRDGYLKASLEEVASAAGVDIELVEKVRSKIKYFDPVGVSSLDLQECLLVQAELLPGDNTLIKKILTDHLKNLERKKYQVIAKDLQIHLKEVVTACEIIADMDPRPGKAYNEGDTQYITPDIYVYKVKGEYVVVLNEDGQPKLKINSFYKKMLANNNLNSDKAKEYIQEKIRSAVWLVKSVYHRQSTIVNVMKSIIKFQRDFFDYGADHLKPLVLRNVADDIEMHESNISRVTTNKYVYTPQGIYELKYFFNSGLNTENGGSIASEGVKSRMKVLIESENPKKPYSDQEIADVFKQQGITIARRTVTKYREKLGILSSSRRKVHI
jgi:RNA polymerase sigma-54 factor